MRPATIASIQPPGPHAAHNTTTECMIERGLHWLEEAGDQHADVALLPEYFNALGLPREELLKAADEAPALSERVADIAARHAMNIVLPMVVKRGQEYVNSTLLVDRNGREIGHYDKIHLTITETQEYGLTAGTTIPVFEMDFGTVGVMVCYDVYFPEISRILGLHGAEIIFFPTLQRSEREEVCALQVRVRAMDSFAYVVRSTCGTRLGHEADESTMRGRSSIVRPDGTVIADAGREEGIAMAAIDLDQRWQRPRCHGSPPAIVRDFILEDRRPDLYGALTAEK